MKNLYSGTNTMTSGSFSSSQDIYDETSGSQFDVLFSPKIHYSRLLSSVVETLGTVKDENVITCAQRFINIFIEALNAQRIDHDISQLPPLRAIHLEDNSLFIEWVFPDFRIGFSLDTHPEKNSWYLVTNKNLEEFSASGYLTENNIKSIILQMVSYAVTNS
jgi:hypothetical protein